MKSEFKKTLICTIDDCNDCITSLKIAKTKKTIDDKLYFELIEFFRDLKYILIGWL